MIHLTTKEKNAIRSANRKAWAMYSIARKEVKTRCRISRGTYRCENCGKIMKGNDSVIAVDHIKQVGSVMELPYLHNLWSDVTNLWGLCNDCHKLKTKLERKKLPLAEILSQLKERK